MSIVKAKILKTVRGRDLKIRYTQDNLADALINQRQFYDQDGFLLAPMTPKLLERQVETNNPTIPHLGGGNPRRAVTCFGSVATLSSESNFLIIIPYAPGDPNHGEHLREIFNYVSPSSNLNPKSALNLSYYGENAN
jgi:hypothetical protein